MKKKLVACLMLPFVFVTNAYSQKANNVAEIQIVKVDFDFSQRSVQEVNDPNYSSWPITETKEAEKSFGNVKIKLKGNFSSKWYKVGISAPFYSRLVSDGLFTDQNLELIISGLKAGEHSLLTFHNTFDKVEGKTFSPIKMYVNDKLAETITPSNRENATIDAAAAYLVFNAETDKEVKIRFEMDATSDAAIIRQMIINGFEIDTPNLKKQSRSPKPEDADEHVVLDKNWMLNWEASKGAVAHNLYFGTHKKTVSEATEKALEFKGKLAENKFQVTDLYSGTTYYWRVDELDAKGIVTQGNIWSFKPAQLAFDGAEGYGRFALGGRGGKVVEVTNLNDSGPGSLRDAVDQNIGPKTIVFHVSGNIELKSRLVVNMPYVTIAGQTAPGEGITISKAPLGLTGNDGIVRFLKVRIGSGTTYDGMGLTGANHSIIDHCSISWTIDESFSSRGAHNITLQRTLIAEALNIAGHDKYEVGKMHGYAATIGGDVGSFHHNLLAHNYGRNWSIGGGLNGDGFYSGRIDIRNNVVYNWGHRTTDGGANEVNFVNNFYKPGASTDIFVALNAQIEGVGKGKQQYYFDGNVMPGYFNEKNQEKGRKFTLSNKAVVNYEVFLLKPFFESYVNTQTAKAAYKEVLSDVGANQPFFDAHDVRIVQETIDGSTHFKGSKSGLAGMIDTEKDLGSLPEYNKAERSSDWDTDHDGLPNWWEVAKGLNLNSAANDFSDANSDNDKDGFTQLDYYLDWMAKPHFFIQLGEKLTLNAKDYFKGYEKKPSFVVSEINNGKELVKGSTIDFIATKKGLASFKITVTDKDGDAMTRTINLFVK